MVLDPFRFHFTVAGKDYSVDIKESTDGVQIGGRTYSLEGSNEAVSLSYQFFRGEQFAKIETLSQLGKVLQKVAKQDVYVKPLLYKTHAIGMEKLKTSKGGTDIPIEKITGYLQSQRNHPLFSGVLSISLMDNVLFEDAFAPPGINQSTPITLQTPFNVMSVGKLHTLRKTSSFLFICVKSIFAAQANGLACKSLGRSPREPVIPIAG